MRPKVQVPSKNIFDHFYCWIKRIPKGRVATYGQIAQLAGLPRHSRHVGFALAAHPGDDIPWHRVINSKGEISPRGEPSFALRQKQLLKKEGIVFNRQDRIVLRRFQWTPPARKR